jgi:uncharacterized protein (TIGR01244 family)
MRPVLIFCLAAFLSAPAFAQATPLPADLGVPNVREAAPGILTGGSPSADDLKRLKDAGYAAVINLEGLEEGSLSEAAIADEVGLHYVALPITRADITRENAEKLHAAIQLSGTPVFVHCASGNRAGALMALRAYFVLDMSPAAAMEEGKKAGLTSLTDVVSDVIAGAEEAKASSPQ